MANEERLHRIIDLIYASAEDRRRWAEALGAIRAELGDVVVNFLVNDLSNEERCLYIAADAPEDVIERYTEYYWKVDPGASAIPFLPEAEIVDYRRIISESEFKSSEFYNDFLVESGAEQVHLLKLWQEDASVSNLSVVYRDASVSEREDTKIVLSAILPHLRRAVRLDRRLFELEVEVGDRVAALDRIDKPVFILDEYGRVRFANYLADELLGSRDGLALEKGRLVGAKPSETTKLERLIDSALRPEILGSDIPVEAIQIFRPSFKRPYSVLAAPLAVDSSLSLPGTRARAVVTIIDPEHIAIPEDAVLRGAFGLTPAEARLAAHLGTGLPLDKCAETLSITIETARSRLKDIFRKTETNRQAELVMLVHRTLAIMRRTRNEKS